MIPAMTTMSGARMISPNIAPTRSIIRLTALLVQGDTISFICSTRDKGGIIRALMKQLNVKGETILTTQIGTSQAFEKERMSLLTDEPIPARGYFPAVISCETKV